MVEPIYPAQDDQEKSACQKENEKAQMTIHKRQSTALTACGLPVATAVVRGERVRKTWEAPIDCELCLVHKKLGTPRAGKRLAQWKLSGERCPQCTSPMLLNHRGHECGSIQCDYVDMDENENRSAIHTSGSGEAQAHDRCQKAEPC